MQVRPAQEGEERAISKLIDAAFAGAEHSGGNEAAIVRGLRANGALALSLVVAEQDRLVGHLAFSPVTIAGRAISWFGLGPVAVLPERQRRGIGAALIAAGLGQLAADGANGCVVLGEPGYYSRFGFSADPQLWLAGVPAEYFQALRLRGDPPRGEVRYHAAFGLA